jgi:hypothetical protein
MKEIHEARKISERDWFRRLGAAVKRWYGRREESVFADGSRGFLSGMYCLKSNTVVIPGRCVGDF